MGDSTLFRYLNNEWRFAPGPHPGSTRLDFSVDFAFKSALYRHLANVFFAEVVQRMMGALEGRCTLLYGSPVARRAAAPAPAGRGPMPR